MPAAAIPAIEHDDVYHVTVESTEETLRKVVLYNLLSETQGYETRFPQENTKFLKKYYRDRLKKLQENNGTDRFRQTRYPVSMMVTM